MHAQMKSKLYLHFLIEQKKETKRSEGRSNQSIDTSCAHFTKEEKKHIQRIYSELKVETNELMSNIYRQFYRIVRLNDMRLIASTEHVFL